MLRRFRCLQRGTVSLCRSTGWKAIIYQSWRYLHQNPHLKTTRVQPGFDSQTKGSSSNFDSLYLCSHLTYRDPQCLFKKIWTSLTYIVSIQRTRRILIISYTLSKWPHLHRAYLLGVWHSFSVTVHYMQKVSFWKFHKNETDLVYVTQN